MSRSYVVGMPCLATIHDDGTVVLTVDLTELDAAVGESWEDQSGDDAYTEAENDQDIETIRKYLAGETPVLIEGSN